MLSIENRLSVREVAAKVRISHQSSANLIRKYGTICKISTHINKQLIPS